MTPDQALFLIGKGGGPAMGADNRPGITSMDDAIRQIKAADPRLAKELGF